MIGSITALVSGGHVKEDDNLFLTIQGMDHSQAQTVAVWLAIATKGPVEVRHISPAEGVGNQVLVKLCDGEWKVTSTPRVIHE